MAWVKYTCGRLKSDYRYSKDIVYNNFIWVEASIPTLPPKGVPPQEVGVVFERVSQLAQNVLDARLLYPTSSLADLYDPITMPVELVKAHNNLDKFVDSLYLDYAKNLGLVPTDSLINSDEDRMKILLELWRKVSG